MVYLQFYIFEYKIYNTRVCTLVTMISCDITRIEYQFVKSKLCQALSLNMSLRGRRVEQVLVVKISNRLIHLMIEIAPMVVKIFSGFLKECLTRLGCEAPNSIIFFVVEQNLRQTSYGSLLVFPLQPPEQHPVHGIAQTLGITFKLV